MLWLARLLVCGDRAQVALRGPSSPAPWKRLPRVRARVCAWAFGRESHLLSSGWGWGPCAPCCWAAGDHRQVQRSRGGRACSPGEERSGGLIPEGPAWPWPARTLARLALPSAEKEGAAGTSTAPSREVCHRGGGLPRMWAQSPCLKPGRHFVSRVCGLTTKPVCGRFQLPSESWERR